MKLVTFSQQHFGLIAKWVPTLSDLMQWGGPFLSFPLSNDQLDAMLAESHSNPPGRLCWMFEDRDGALSGHAQLAFDWRNGNAILGRVAIAPEKRGQGLAVPMLNLLLTKLSLIQK